MLHVALVCSWWLGLLHLPHKTQFPLCFWITLSSSSSGQISIKVTTLCWQTLKHPGGSDICQEKKKWRGNILFGVEIGIKMLTKTILSCIFWNSDVKLCSVMRAQWHPRPYAGRFLFLVFGRMWTWSIMPQMKQKDGRWRFSLTPLCCIAASRSVVTWDSIYHAAPVLGASVLQAQPAFWTCGWISLLIKIIAIIYLPSLKFTFLQYLCSENSAQIWKHSRWKSPIRAVTTLKANL